MQAPDWSASGTTVYSSARTASNIYIYIYIYRHAGT